jgi:aspartate carbamoyltransferase catalytic subunit
MNHVLSAAQFDLSELQIFLAQAADMEKILDTQGHCDLANGKILATLFYEPSTRTRLSFETAMHRLGGSVISESNSQFSSRYKGEVIQDTIRMVGGYADIVAMRSPNKGEVSLAAGSSPVPVLNAGDGAGEHPTQGLLDLYTIHKKFPFLGKEPLNIAFVGDLKYGRTVHSLVTYLRNFEHVTITFIAPDGLQIPDKYFAPTDTKTEELSDAILAKQHVVYATRIQQERFATVEEFKKYDGVYVFDVPKVKAMKNEAILLHPLPRINEITMDVDALPQAHYFEEAKNGVPVRMALIARSLGLI